MDELRCAIEIRETDGRARLVGTLLRYGEVASDRRERFAKGALTWPADGVVLREQHDRSQPIARVVPVVRGDEVVIDSLLPDTQRAKDAATMIREGVFRGLSVEFTSARSSADGGDRVIESALLVGAGLVDDPAYTGSRVDVRSKAQSDLARRHDLWL